MLQEFRAFVGDRRFTTILADPPWRFQNRNGKVAPEYRRLARYDTLKVEDIMALPVSTCIADTAHLYLWVPNALLPEGLRVMDAWGFTYKSVIVWHKIRKDGETDGSGVGFYFRNATETLLFGMRGSLFRSLYNLIFHRRDEVTETLMFGVRGAMRTLAPARTQTNYLATRRREHSRKPDEQYDLIEACSPGPFLELFARGVRPGWSCWGYEAIQHYWPTAEEAKVMATPSINLSRRHSSLWSH